MKRLGIKHQILLVSIVPLLAMAALLTGYLIHSRFVSMSQSFDKRGYLLASQFARSSEYAVFSGNLALLNNMTESMADESDMKAVMVFDAKSNLLVSHGTPDIAPQNVLAGLTFEGAMAEDANAIWVKVPIVATEIKLDDFDFENEPSQAHHPLGTVVVEFSKRNINLQKRNTLVIDLLTSLLFLIATLGVSLRASHRIIAPVMEMKNVVASIGRGNLNVRFPSYPEAGELGELAAGIEQMAKLLQHERSELEARILEATREISRKKDEAEFNSNEKSKLNELLEKSLSLLHETLESSVGGIIAMDNLGKIVISNSKFKLIWGVPDEMLQPGDGPAILVLIQGRLKNPGQLQMEESGTPPEAGAINVLELKDGRFIESQLQPYFVGGAQAGRVWSFRDITKQKIASMEAEYLNKLNNAIIDFSPLGIGLYHAEGPCIMANEAYAQLVGGTIQKLLKLNFRTIDTWRRNHLVELADEALKTGRSMRRDVETTTIYGKNIAIEAAFVPIQIADAQFLLVIFNDVLARVDAEMALKRSVRLLEEKELAKSRFLAAAGHDLRQPLAAANLFIDALGFSGLTTRQEMIVNRLEHVMEDFGNLLDALLNISKLDAGIIVPEYSDFDVVSIFNSIEQSLAPLAQQKHLDFRLYFPIRTSLIVHSDYALIRSVLLNLVGNAIKFTERGAVLMSARTRGDTVLFQVWDTGIGMKPESLDQIYDEFYQAENRARDVNKGLGLGLAIVKRILKLLDVEIACRSVVGRGSVFSFSLPRANIQAERLPDARPRAEGGGTNEISVMGKKFVVAEDDLRIVHALTSLLELMGADVLHFKSAEDALSYDGISGADYYISDYMLGGQMNGIEFLQRLRDIAGHEIKAVLLTGDTSSGFVGQTTGFDWPILHKPVNVHQLISKLEAQTQNGQ